MKKAKYTRYDLDKVYYLNEYNKTVAYGNSNKHLEGVKTELDNLELEKKQYFKIVSDIVNPEKEKEEAKYLKYTKWEKAERTCKYIEIICIVIAVAVPLALEFLPMAFRQSILFGLFFILLPTAFASLVGPLLFISSKIIKHGYGTCYKHYIEPISQKLNSAGQNFNATCIGYYDRIDNLYLLSLDPAHREMVFFRREQEAHNQKMLSLEKARQQTENERLREQQRAREATEELLAIERERERRYNRW